MKAFATAIYLAVSSGRLAQPFDAHMAERAVPGWAERTYYVFFDKHRIGNPGHNTELFVRVRPGRFTIVESLADHTLRREAAPAPPAEQ